MGDSMKTSSSSDSAEWWRPLSEQLRRHGRTLESTATFVAGLAFFGLVLDFRGIAPDALTLTETARSLTESSQAGLSPTLLESTHPFVELLASWLFRISGAPLLASLQPLSLFAVAGALPAIWGIATRIGDRRHGVAAVVIFATLPQVAGAGTTVGAAAVFVFLWSWFLRLVVVDRHRWFGTLPLWMLAAALVLTWPPFILAGVLWLYVELRESTRTASADSEHLPGEVPAGALPIAVALLPLAALALATLLHPALRSAPVEGWSHFFDFVLRWNGTPFQFAGTLYAEARPPLWSGYALLWWMVPTASILAALGGWLCIVSDPWKPSRSGRLVQRLCLWGLPLAGLLPWLHRGVSWGRISFVLAAGPLLAVCGALFVVRALDGFEALIADRVPRPVRNVAIVTASLALAVALSALVHRAHPVEGSYYTSTIGGFGGAVERGLPVSRDRVYPIEVVRRASSAVSGGSIAAIEDADLVRAYRDMGLLGEISAAGSPFDADARIRRLGEFDPGSDSVGKNPNAVVDLSGTATPLYSVDGIPIYWLEQ